MNGKATYTHALDGTQTNTISWIDSAMTSPLT